MHVGGKRDIAFSYDCDVTGVNSVVLCDAYVLVGAAAVDDMQQPMADLVFSGDDHSAGRQGYLQHKQPTDMSTAGYISHKQTTDMSTAGYLSYKQSTGMPTAGVPITQTNHTSLLSQARAELL